MQTRLVNIKDTLLSLNLDSSHLLQWHMKVSFFSAMDAFAYVILFYTCTLGEISKLVDVCMHAYNEIL